MLTCALQILRIFHPDLLPSDMLSQSQFFAILRLLAHAHASPTSRDSLDTVLVFVQRESPFVYFHCVRVMASCFLRLVLTGVQFIVIPRVSAKAKLGNLPFKLIPPMNCIVWFSGFITCPPSPRPSLPPSNLGKSPATPPGASGPSPVCYTHVRPRSLRRGYLERGF